MLIQNRLCFYYEHILRQDLLLKLNYSNIMEVPRVDKIVMVSQVPNGSVQNMALALESLCGQKCVESERLSPSNKVRVKKALLFKKARGTLTATSQVRGCLRKRTMYHFLDKLLTLISFYDYTVKIQFNFIQLTIGTNLLRLFPEIQNHFELFESTQTLQVILVTSAKTETETRLLWTGLSQKEV